ncbi:MAG: hypothetical protein QXE79_02630 [Candidatus Bathyarchaeia archaeon]
MFKFDVKYRKVVRSGLKYNFEVKIYNQSDRTLESPNIIIRRSSSSSYPIRILDWWSRDSGAHPDKRWNFYYFPIEKIFPGETKSKLIAFDVSPTFSLGIYHLYVSVQDGNEQPPYHSKKWKKMILIKAPKGMKKKITMPPCNEKPLWDYLPPLLKYGWKIVFSSHETRNVEGFVLGICSVYSLREKTVGIFIFKFDNEKNAEKHFEDKIKEWNEKSNKIGEKSIIFHNGLKINRYIFPKNGIIFGWYIENLIFTIYAPTAVEEDLRKIVNLIISRLTNRDESK